ncbi:MAG: protein kinase [Bacteroidaceae bacterium]|nr:protein kinase [Bacteroidaceae bacterium]
MAFLEDYTLLDELGQGGFATVYKVRHNNLGYIRALRVLNATIARGEKDEAYQKFLEECRLLLRLGNGNHPNIVHIYQPLLKAQKAIVEMDFVDGKDLSHYLIDKHSFMEIEDVLRLLTDIGSALAYCHEDIYKSCMDKELDNLLDDPNDGRKALIDDDTKRRLIDKYRVVHNDIHSGNIIRRENGSYVLLDFGLAIEGESVIRSSRRKNGAPEFKAPEKWDNESLLAPQSDIYSFGVVLYEYLAGRVPFMRDIKNHNSVEAEYLLVKAHKEQKPAPIFELRKAAFEQAHPGETYEKDYPDWLEDVIFKCLEKSPDNRFKNGKDLYTSVLKYIGSDRDVLTNNLKLEAEQSQKEIAHLQEEIKHFKSEINRLLEQKADFPNPAEHEKLILNLQNQLKDVLYAKSMLEMEVKNLRATNERLKVETGVENNDKKLYERIEELENALKQAEEELQQIPNKLSVAIKENDELKKEIVTLKKNTGKGGAKIWKILFLVMFALAFFSWAINITQSSTGKDTEYKEKYNAELKKNKELAAAVKELEKANFNGETGSNNSTIKNLKDELAAKDAIIADLSSKISGLEKNATSSGGMTDALSELNTQLQEIEAENAALKNQLAAAKKKIGAGTNQDAEIKKLKKTIEEKERLIKVLNTQLGVQ